MKERKKSQEIHSSASKVIPGGVNSPVRAFGGLGLSPLVVDYGKGDLIYDLDGHSYIDFCCSWGALLFGHAYPPIVQAAVEQMKKGSSFGIATSCEQEIASLLVSLLPSLEKVRFVSSGTEATMTALRLARGYTGRPRIVKFNGNYHGHSDSLLIQAGSGVSQYIPQASSQGIPEEIIKYTHSLPYNDIETVQKFLRTQEGIAAVIIEPIAGNMGVVPASKEFLQMLREETQKKGIVLIFDEVISGFRVGLKGVQGLYGITPDLTCLGKIIGGGFPAAAFGGKKEIMDCLAPLGPVYQAGTLSGNPVAMQAGLAALRELSQEGFYEKLQEKTDRFTLPIKQAIKNKKTPLCFQQEGSMFTLFFGVNKVTSKEDLAKMDQELFKKFFQFLFDRGVYISPSPYEASFVSTAHTEENLNKTRDLILEFLQSLA